MKFDSSGLVGGKLMADFALLRKAVLAAALMGALYAAFLMPGDTQEYQSPPVAETIQKPLLSVQPAAEIRPAADDEETDTDPFAPRNWNSPAPDAVVAQAVSVAAREPEAVISPSAPPPLPFKFAGRMNDGDNQVIYLARGDTALIARNGEVLESTYKIVSINAGEIEFEHLPSGQKQVLPLPGPER